MYCEVTRHLSRQCKIMRRLIHAHGKYGLVPQRRRSPFEALVRAVAHQQLNGTAAEAILKRFCALFPGGKFPSPEQLLAIDETALRQAGFSRGKIASLRDIAAKTISGIIPGRRELSKLTDEEIISRLIEVRGVGRWTAEMLLMFTLGRADVFPVDDFGVRNGYRIAFGLREMPKPKQLLSLGEHWRPYRTAASWYLWRAADAARKTKPIKGITV